MAGLPNAPMKSRHSLSMASASHLHKMGHITEEQRDRIHESARAEIAEQKKQKVAPAPSFGSLAPPMGAAGAGMPQAAPRGPFMMRNGWV